MPLASPRSPSSTRVTSLLAAMLSAPLGWLAALWSAHRAWRRLRAYGPPARLDLRHLPRLPHH